MDRGDRGLAVLGRLDEREAAVGLERGADLLGSLGDLVGRDRHAHERLDRDVVREVGWRVDDLHATLYLVLPGARTGDRQDRRADRVRTVAHQVVAVVPERRDARSASRRRRRGPRRPRPAPAPGRRPSSAATSADDGRVDAGAGSAPGRTRTSPGRSPRAHAAASPGRPCRRASRRPSPGPRAPGRHPRWPGRSAARSARNAAIDRITSGGSSRFAQELVDVHAARCLDRLPAAVDQDEPGASVRRAAAAAQARDDRAEAVAGEHDPIVGRRPADRIPRRPRGRRRRSPAGRSPRSARRTGRGRAGPWRPRAGRAAAGERPGVHDQLVFDSPWISRTPGPPGAAPVEEVDPLAGRDLDHEPGRFGPAGSGGGTVDHRP